MSSSITEHQHLIGVCARGFDYRNLSVHDAVFSQYYEDCMNDYIDEIGVIDKLYEDSVGDWADILFQDGEIHCYPLHMIHEHIIE